jgi:hypothetical protein
MREHGLMDAKAMVAADASCLIPAADKALVSDGRGTLEGLARHCPACEQSVQQAHPHAAADHPPAPSHYPPPHHQAIQAAEAEAALAEAARLAAEEEAADLPAGWGPRDVPQDNNNMESFAAFAAVAAAAAPASAGAAAVLDAIKRSPLMLDLPANHAGISAVVGMPDDLVVDAITLLVRTEGYMDAKAILSKDASVLSALADEVLVIREEEAAAAAAAEAEAAAAAEAEAEGAVVAEVAAPVAAAAPASAEIASVLAAIQRSPLMLELPASHKGLAAIAGMPDDLVVDAITFLVREVGWMEAKNYVAEDAEVLSEAADEVLAIREAEAKAAAEAALLAEAEAAAEEAAAAAEASAPAAFAYAPAPSGPIPTAFEIVIDAIQRSPLSLELPGNHPGLSAIAHLVS